jgi:hypothetical protein
MFAIIPIPSQSKAWSMDDNRDSTWFDMAVMGWLEELKALGPDSGKLWVLQRGTGVAGSVGSLMVHKASGGGGNVRCREPGCTRPQVRAFPKPPGHRHGLLPHLLPGSPTEEITVLKMNAAVSAGHACLISSFKQCCPAQDHRFSRTALDFVPARENPMLPQQVFLAVSIQVPADSSHTIKETIRAGERQKHLPRRPAECAVSRTVLRKRGCHEAVRLVRPPIRAIDDSHTLVRTDPCLNLASGVFVTDC